MSTADAESGAALGALRLLRVNRPLRTLFGARVVSCAGDSMSLVALMLHVAATTGQGLAVALLLLIGDVVPSLFGPVAGAVSDRFDLRRVMIVCEILQGGLVLAVASALPFLPMPLLLVLVGLRAVAYQVFQPASRSAVPAMVAERELGTANSTVGLGSNCAEAFGPFLAAALLGPIGVRGVLVVDAASFLVSATMLAATRPMPPVTASGGGGTLLGQARVGLGYILRTRAVRIVALGFCAVVMVNGVDDVALVLLATDTLRAGGSAVALLLGAVGIGLLAGYALLTRSGRRPAMPALLVGGFLVSSAGNLLTGLAWSVAAAFTLQAVRGLGIAGMDVASSTMLARMVPAGMLGRVFGNFYGAVGVAAALSYVGGGLLLDATNAPVTLIVAGAAGVVFSLAVAVSLRGALPARAGDREGPPRASDRPGRGRIPAMANEFEEFNNRVIGEFRDNDGQVGPPFEGATMILVHHVGAKSGTERITPLVWFADGDRYVIVASKGGAPEHPAWYHNLKANPDITVEIGHGPEARTETLRVRAEELPEPDRERMWGHITSVSEGFADYDRKTRGVRTIPLFGLTPKAA